MEIQEWEDKVKNAKCPETWSNDLLGYDTEKGIKGLDLRFYPGMSNIDEINAIEEDFCFAITSDALSDASTLVTN